MPRPNTAARIQGAGGCDIFYAVRSQIRDGYQICDIVNPDGALAYFGCTVMNGQGNRIGAPSEKWNGDLNGNIHPQVVVLYRSGGRSPIVLGRIDNPNILYSSEADNGANAENRDVSGDTVSLADVLMCNDGSRFVMKAAENGGDIIFSPVRGMQFQLQSDGVMRVSRDGDAADGPVLAQPYVDHDNAILDYLGRLHHFVSSLLVDGEGIVRQVNPESPKFISETDFPDRITLGQVKSAVLALSSDTMSGTIEE